jgi:hypothetical protein
MDSFDKRPKPWIADMQFGMWNAQSLHTADLVMTVAKNYQNINYLVGVHEITWDRGGT